jgi:hypothetical protein
MARVFLCIALAFSVSLPAMAADDKAPITETRRHFRVAAESGAVLYEGTEVTRASEDISETHLLVSDSGDANVILRRLWAFKSQAVTYRISDVKDRTFIQVSYKLPFVAKTRRETLDEARGNTRLMDVPSIVRVETNGGRWDGFDTEWDEYTRLRQVRHDLRQTIDFWLLEAIERMRGTLFVTEFADTFLTLIGRIVIYDYHADTSSTSDVHATEVFPDCAFDAGFGYPCSEKQLARIKAAAKQSEPLTIY